MIACGSNLASHPPRICLVVPYPDSSTGNCEVTSEGLSPTSRSERTIFSRTLSSHHSQFALDWLPPAAGPCAQKAPPGDFSSRHWTAADPSSVSVCVIALSTFVSVSIPRLARPIGQLPTAPHVLYQSRGTCSSLRTLQLAQGTSAAPTRTFEPVPGTYSRA
jgi:hypothetical protein